jgi:hypothetical protein
MRTHREWPLLQVWSRQRNLKAWITAENLRVARLEAVTIKNMPAAVLDLRFVSAQDVGVSVPACMVDLKALESRTRDALIWPQGSVETCKDEELYAIECLLVDWLRAEVSGGNFSGERVRRFGEGDQCFETARHARSLGASCYGDIAMQLAAAHYAARFVPGKMIQCVASLPNVASLLAPAAAGCIVAGADPAQNILSFDWFGCEFLNADSTTQVTQLAIVDGREDELDGRLAANARIIDVKGILPGTEIRVGASCALDDLVRLSEPSSTSMRVQSPGNLRESQSMIPEKPAATGGSSGRILLVVREDALRASGADTDEAFALRRLLIREGFAVDVAAQPALYDPAAYDLVHGFGMLSSQSMRACFQAAKHAGVPTVLTACFEDYAVGGIWGARASRSLLDLVVDDAGTKRMLDILSTRMVNVDGLIATERFDNGEEGVRKALVCEADFVLTHSESERAALENYSGRNDGIAVTLPLIYREEARVSVAHLVPDQAYMFVHAGIEARQNTGLIMHAASALEIPCVFAGAVLDRRLYRHMASRVGTNIALVPECSAAELAAMAESASVYIDAAWYGDGMGRILRGILHGGVAVVSESRHLDEALEEAVLRIDPSSIDSLRNGMSEAWQRSGSPQLQAVCHSIASCYEADAVFKSIISSYATADERRREPVMS